MLDHTTLLIEEILVFGPLSIYPQEFGHKLVSGNTVYETLGAPVNVETLIRFLGLLQANREKKNA